MIVQFRLRRADAAEWATLNPILQDGEPGWEQDTNRIKMGDGETPWNDLGYATYPATEYDQMIADLTQDLTGIDAAVATTTENANTAATQAVAASTSAADAEAAASRSEAVGATNDAIVSGLVYNPTSQTTTALTAKYVNVGELILNVKDAPYNAKGDGVTDDSAAIQAALNVGGNVYLPAGVYLCGTRLTLKQDGCLTGAGRTTSTIKAPTGMTDYQIELGNFGSRVTNLYIDGNETACQGVLINDSNEQSGLEHVIIGRQRGRCIHVTPAGGSIVPQNYYIEDVELYRSASADANPTFHIGAGTTAGRTIRNVTINVIGLGTPPAGTTGFKCEVGQQAVDFMHIEHHPVAVDLAAASGFQGRSISMSQGCTRGILIANGTNSVVLQGIQNNSAGHTSTIEENSTGTLTTYNGDVYSHVVFSGGGAAARQVMVAEAGSIGGKHTLSNLTALAALTMPLYTAATKPAAVAGSRGRILTVDNGTGVVDDVLAGTKDASGSYSWKSLTPRERSVFDHGGVADCTQPSQTIALTSGSASATLSGTVTGLVAGQKIVTDSGTYTISSVSGTAVTLSTTSTATVSAAPFFYGTDNTAAFNALFAYCILNMQTAVIPNGRFLITGTIGVLEPGPNASKISSGLTIQCGGMVTNAMRLSYMPASMAAGTVIAWGGAVGGTMMQFSRMIAVKFIGGMTLAGQACYDPASVFTTFGPKAGLGLHVSQNGAPTSGTGYFDLGSMTFYDMDTGIQFGTNTTDNNCDTTIADQLLFIRCSSNGILVKHAQGLSYRFNWIHGISCPGSVVKFENGGACEIGSLHLSLCGTGTATPLTDTYSVDLASSVNGFAFSIDLMRIENSSIRSVAVRNAWTHLRIGVFEEANISSTDDALFLVMGGVLDIQGGQIKSVYASGKRPFYAKNDVNARGSRIVLQNMSLARPDNVNGLFSMGDPNMMIDYSIIGCRDTITQGVAPTVHKRLERGPARIGGPTTDATTAVRLDEFNTSQVGTFVYSRGPRIPKGVSVIDMVLIGGHASATPSVFKRKYTFWRGNTGDATLLATETIGTDLVSGTDQISAVLATATFHTFNLSVKGTAATTVNWSAWLTMSNNFDTFAPDL